MFYLWEIQQCMPVFSGRRIFNPVWIFRMANLDLFNDFLGFTIA